MSKKLWFSAIATAVALVGCGGGVDLNQYSDDGINGSSGNSGVTTVDTGSVGSHAGPSSEVSRVVYFDYDSYVVQDGYRSVITANAQYLRANPAARVVLEGNTDERGSTEYNLALGQKRAEAVRQALLLLGVSEMQMEAVSYGKERPAVIGSGEEAWSKNRRVDFSYR